MLRTPVGIGPTLPVKLLLASALHHSGALQRASAISLSLIIANSPKYCPPLTIIALHIGSTFILVYYTREAVIHKFRRICAFQNSKEVREIQFKQL